MTNDQILDKLRAVLHDAFEIDPGTVNASTHLFNDLDLDSIDAVDLAIKLQEMTGKRIKPDEFRTVRTVGDVVEAVQRLLVA